MSQSDGTHLSKCYLIVVWASARAGPDSGAPTALFPILFTRELRPRASISSSSSVVHSSSSSLSSYSLSLSKSRHLARSRSMLSIVLDPTRLTYGVRPRCSSSSPSEYTPPSPSLSYDPVLCPCSGPESALRYGTELPVDSASSSSSSLYRFSRPSIRCFVAQMDSELEEDGVGDNDHGSEEGKLALPVICERFDAGEAEDDSCVVELELTASDDPEYEPCIGSTSVSKFSSGNQICPNPRSCRRVILSSRPRASCSPSLSLLCARGES
jgi:hypothetical protein